MAQNEGVFMRIAIVALLAALPLLQAVPEVFSETLPPSGEVGGAQPVPPPDSAPSGSISDAPQVVPATMPTQAAQPASPKEEDLTQAYRGIVKIEVANRTPDYRTPWNAGGFGRGNGTGFMVGNGLFMTNAHVVANAERIYVSPWADSRKLPATVKFVAHDADLALLEVKDVAPFRDVPCLEFSDSLPKLEDTVRAIGYPIGGDRLSVTRGIVSRIDTVAYAHPRNQSHLVVQIDAAINPGNSGGPVLMDDKVVGVAFQGIMEANSTGYVIPMPVIRRFLKDVEDGHYDAYVNPGVWILPLENPAMRKRLGLKDDARGALVGDVVRGGSCDGVLQPGDVVLSVNGHEVDSSAMIELDGERVQLMELAERAFNGDKLRFVLLRKGELKEAETTLKPLPAASVTANAYDQLPRYVEFAGLVFQPLQLNVIAAHQLDAADFMVDLDDFQRKGGSQKKEDIVVLTKVLRDEVNARFTDFGRRIVTRVNGQEVRGLAHLYSLLYPEDGGQRPPYTVIEFADAARPIVISSASVEEANARISAGYNIPAPARLHP